MRFKKKSRRLSHMHPAHRAVILIMSFLLLWVLGNAIYSGIQYRLIDTLVIDSETKDITLDGYGFIHANAETIRASNDGQIEMKAIQGERVAKNQKIFILNYKEDSGEGKKVKKKEFLAPQPGIINYFPDGYENINDLQKVATFDLKHIYETEKGEKHHDAKKRSVSSGEVCATVIDNLKPVTMYFPYMDEKNKIINEVGDAVRVRFPDFGDDVVAFIQDIQKTSDGQMWCELNLGPMSDEFLQDRVVQAQLYRREKNMLVLPKDSLVAKTDEASNKKMYGVYIVNKGVVTWRPVTIKKETKDKVICDILPKDTEIILTPKRVRENDLLK